MEILYIFIGLIVGFLICCIPKFLSSYDGSIIIDDTDNDKTTWIIAYDGDPYEISKRKVIKLKVRIKK